MSLQTFLRSRGIPPETVNKMEADKIDIDVIIEMSDLDLQEYLPSKGDRVALKAFVNRQQSETENDKRKLSLIENLRSRMKLASKSKYPSDSDDEKSTLSNLKNHKKLPFFSRWKELLWHCQ
ncbi:uncharacterized protein LOC121377798 [Gigantopelta aegis]|uniref:uncharacterized protein LOC121377798 n=1 Tax=Gigantopelta aegis TaxID=1735272 RepID=UPI001B88A5F0|nr:uncharacterized protein LOC121377798 [Gigantopelta aegis]